MIKARMNRGDTLPDKLSFTELKEDVLAYGDNYAKEEYYYLRGRFCLERQDTANALENFQRSLAVGDTLYTSRQYRLLADINWQIAEIYGHAYLEKEHKRFLGQALSVAQRAQDQSRVALIRNAQKEAEEFYKKFTDSERNQLHLLGIQSRFDHQKHLKMAEQKRGEARKFYKMAALMLLTVVICTECLWLYLRKVRRERKETLRGINSRYNQYLQDYNRLVEKLAFLKMEEKDKQMQIERDRRRIEELKLEIARSQENRKTEIPWQLFEELSHAPVVLQFHKLAAQSRIPKTEEWMELRKELNRYYPDFIPSLLHKATLNYKETGVCILTKLRFIPSEMAVLLSTSIQNISTMRARLNMKLYNKKGKAADFDEAVQQATRF